MEKQAKRPLLKIIRSLFRFLSEHKSLTGTIISIIVSLLGYSYVSLYLSKFDIDLEAYAVLQDLPMFFVYNIGSILLIFAIGSISTLGISICITAILTNRNSSLLEQIGFIIIAGLSIWGLLVGTTNNMTSTVREIKAGRSDYFTVSYGRGSMLQCINYIGRTSSYRFYWDSKNSNYIAIPDSQHIEIKKVFGSSPKTNYVYNETENKNFGSPNITQLEFGKWKEELLNVCTEATPIDIEVTRVENPCNIWWRRKAECIPF